MGRGDEPDGQGHGRGQGQRQGRAPGQGGRQSGFEAGDYGRHVTTLTQLYLNVG